MEKTEISVKMKSKFPPRIIETQGIKIYASPCTASNQQVEPFISQFVQNHPWYVKIDRDWAADWFNSCLLDEMVPNFDMAMEVISDEHSENWVYLDDSKVGNITLQASHLYGLLHSRWICQSKGLSQMKQKIDKSVYGKCPRFLCGNSHLVPMGTTLKPRRHTVKLFCPRCYDIYIAPKDIVIDGCHFGPAFPHMFLAEFDKLNMQNKFTPFVRTAFGFPVHGSMIKRFVPHRTNRQEDEFPDVTE